MENENQKENAASAEKAPAKKESWLLPASILAAAVMLSGALVYNALVAKNDGGRGEESGKASIEEKVAPAKGVVLPARWGDLGKRLVEAGVIDAGKFRSLYSERGELSEEFERLLSGENNGKLKITRENSGYLLNLLWALGLSNKNQILSSGEMVDEKYGGVGNFASTAGWTISQGSPMNHYGKHEFLKLSPEQQELVDKISRGIYRPCCNNSVHFPDCNHGMAMLGLLELMASGGATEEEMWKAALAVNSYWFPDVYVTLASYLEGQGVDWKDASPVTMLGFNYSSYAGYAKVLEHVSNPSQKSGGGCSV